MRRYKITGAGGAAIVRLPASTLLLSVGIITSLVTPASAQAPSCSFSVLGDGTISLDVSAPPAGTTRQVVERKVADTYWWRGIATNGAFDVTGDYLPEQCFVVVVAGGDRISRIASIDRAIIMRQSEPDGMF